MPISLSVSRYSLVEFITVEVTSLRELGEVVCEHQWCPALFKGGYRKTENFTESRILALDIDEGLTIEEACKKLEGLAYLIGTTRSHMKEKNGKVVERFRIVVPLREPINDAAVYEANVRALAERVGHADPQALDAARFFYPCQEIVRRAKGNLLSPSERVGTPEEATQSSCLSRLDVAGQLSRSTLDFLALGAPEGQRNARLFKAAVDCNEQGFEELRAREVLTNAALTCGLGVNEINRTISSAYNRTPKYEPRKIQSERSEALEVPTFDERLVVTPKDLAKSCFDYLSDKESVKGQPTGFEDLDKLLGGGFRKGELNVWHAIAKTGKNSIWHAMIMRMMTLYKLPIGYASREITPETEVLPNLLSIHFKENAWKQELTPERKKSYREALGGWPLYFASGYGYFNIDQLRAWVKLLKLRYNVEHFFFDHLHFMLQSPEDYTEASILIKEIKTMAKEEDISMHVIVQPNKMMPDQELSLNSLKGGAAIGQALDNLIILTRKTGDPNVSKIVLEQARHKLAKLGSFYLHYNSETTDFSVVDLVDENDEPQPEPLELLK